MNLSQYLSAAVSGTPLLFLVFGLVEILKRLKKGDGSTQLVSGNLLLLGSLLIGLLVGLGYAVFQQPPPALAKSDGYAHYVYWFGAAVYGLGLGLLASLFFDTLKGLVNLAVGKLGAK